MMPSFGGAGMQLAPNCRRVAAFVSRLAAEANQETALVCSAFDEAVEFAAYEGRSASEAAAEFFAEDWGPAQAELRKLVQPGRPVSMPDLPVMPEAAACLIHASSENLSLAELTGIAKSDATLTARLLSIANSRRFGGEKQITRVREAIARIGVPEARKALLAGCLSELFASRELRDLWDHSRLVASIAWDLAKLTRVDAETAWVAGLLHDIGRMGFMGLPGSMRSSEQGWRESGFPMAYAEMMAYGQDHASFGAEWMKGWDVPAEITDAVEHHHRPESTTSALSATLCLAEDIAGQLGSGESEDLWPSLRRQLACRNAGIEIDELDALTEQQAKLQVNCA